MSRPDAIMIPESYKGSGATQHQRVDTLCSVAEQVLQPDKSKDEKVWVRLQPGGQCFVTRDPNDTIRYPKTHPLKGQARYEWRDHETLQGVRVGTLKEAESAQT